MQVAVVVVFLSGVYPWWRAWRYNRYSPLCSALAWAIAAWASWAMLALVAETPGGTAQAQRYLALSLTCCAGVAVLGARRPGAPAWNAVVVGLLAILLLPLAEQLVVGANSFGWVRVLFLAATLAFIALNYLPTCFLFAAFVFLAAVGMEFWLTPEFSSAAFPELPSLLGLALLPWLALLLWQFRARPASEFDRLWRDFRDRYGLVWAARVREQFNRAAENAGWPVQLGWHGLRERGNGTVPGMVDHGEYIDALKALLKRFV
jgi:hypothetical protein